MKHILYTREEVLNNLKNAKAYEAEDGDIFITKMLDGVETVIAHFGKFGYTEEDEYIRYSEEDGNLFQYSLEGEPMEDVGHAYGEDWMTIKPIDTKHRIGFKSVFTGILCTMSALLFIWFALSYAEVVTHNTVDAPYEYHPYNLLTMFIGEEEATEEVAVEHTAYTTYGRYYLNGEVVTNDGNIWDYQTDTISDREAYDAMPVWIAFDDNGTPDDIADDIVLGLVYDVNTAIYDELEDSLSETFTVTREGNKLTVKP